MCVQHYIVFIFIFLKGIPTEPLTWGFVSIFVSLLILSQNATPPLGIEPRSIRHWESNPGLITECGNHYTTALEKFQNKKFA